MRFFQLGLLAAILPTITGVAAAETVKRTSSGICHPPASSYYERTKNFRPFDSVDACLASGGRLPKKLAQNQSAQAARDDSTSYERSAFGYGWEDVDGDCQNSRAEALIATSSTTVRFATDRKCRVIAGRWISPFTGNVIQNSGEIDIDHLVPLKWAWNRGAKNWSQAKRETFANDMVNLWPVELSLNRSKGARGPEEWLPPTGQCGYVARFLRTVKQYNLRPSSAEAKWFKSFLNRCRS
ncbi:MULTISPECIES: HNH endonuclease family protein [Marinobacter]|uniref:HNH endonuclease family protein n=1 Tax=Marinobacter TaxID=2742 RepID=UPI0012459699|nr:MULTISPECIES: HNH endonuclease family protein [Marinobacter]MBL3557610.1 HNH endonuclease [Marinobacter sp. JB05H06]